MLMSFSCCLAWIRALSLWGSGSVLCAVIRWAGDTRGLLWFGLIISFTTFDANIDRHIEISSRCANGKWTFFNWSWSDFWCCSAQWTGSTSWLNSLRSECSTRTWLAFSIDTKLHTWRTFVTTFGSWFRFSWSCCLSKSANFTSEWAFVWLEESVTTRSAESSIRVEIFSGRATFLAVGGWSCSITDCDTRSTWNVWTFCALSLTSFRLIKSSWTTWASFVWSFVECSDGTRYTIGNHCNLTNWASIIWAQFEWWWIWYCVG